MIQEVVNFFCELRRMFAAQEFCDLLIRYGMNTCNNHIEIEGSRRVSPSNILEGNFVQE